MDSPSALDSDTAATKHHSLRWLTPESAHVMESVAEPREARETIPLMFLESLHKEQCREAGHCVNIYQGSPTIEVLA